MNGAWRLAFDQPAAALAAAATALVLAAVVRRTASARAAGLRLVVGLLLAGALAEPRLVPRDASDRQVVVDTSGSLAPGALATAWPGGGPDASGAGWLAFGDRSASPLGAALDLVGTAVDGVVVVASDGAATDGAAAEAAARAAAARGVRVDAVALAGRSGVDAAVTSLGAAPVWRAGDRAIVEVGVSAVAPVSATVELTLDGQSVGRRPASVGPQPGALAFELDVPPGDGPIVVEARVAAPGDREPANDARRWVVQRGAPPRVLVVGDTTEAVGLADALLAEGLAPDVLGPTRLSGRRSALAAWDVVVVVDLPAAVFGVDQLAVLEALVAEHGQGLVLTGGRQSFLQGGWRGTALARLSPLTLEAPPQGDREAVALLVMVDRSASMAGGDAATQLTKLDLAREAAVLAAEVLQPGDSIGVLAYDAAAEWIVPLGPIAGEVGAIEAALRRLAAGGGTLIDSALAVGLPALAAIDAPTRHAVLLSDGRDAGESDAPLLAAVAAARDRGITFSTLGIGRDADPDLLGRLAQIGRGRAYTAIDAGDLPRLTVEESEIVRARAERSGTFRPQRRAGGEADALVAGVDVGALPALSGYLALRPRPAARVALESPAGDPLLAGWQVGLGRVAAWTSDVGAAWATAWPADAAGRAALARAVRWAARRPATAGIDAVATTDDATGRTVVEAVVTGVDGGPLDLAAVTLVVTATEGASRTPLEPVAPGRYAATVTLPRAGAWPAAVRVDDGGGGRAAPLTLARGYAPELVPDAGGAARLARVAAAGGGAVVPAAEALTAPRGTRPRALWAWLVALAAAVWPLDVAAQLADRRRRAQPRRGDNGGRMGASSTASGAQPRTRRPT